MKISPFEGNHFGIILSLRSMRSLFFTLVFGLLLANSTVRAAGPDGLATQDGTATAIDSSIVHARINEWLAEFDIPGMSMAFIEHDSIVYTLNAGYLSETDGPVIDGSRFQAASISKPTTAMLCMMLKEQSGLDLDADINSLMHSWQLKTNRHSRKKAVSLRLLLSHRAGTNLTGFLGYNRERRRIPNLEEVLNGKHTYLWEPRLKVRHPVGVETRYSGGGYCLVQKFLEERYGRSLEVIADSLLFGPIGMSQSFFGYYPEERGGSFAKGHKGNGKMVKGFYHVYPQQTAAGLWTSSRDLSLLLIEMRKARAAQSSILMQSSYDEMFSADLGPFGLGFQQTYAGDGSLYKIWHNGGNHGYISHMRIDVKSGTGLVVMTNSNNGWELIDAISQMYFSEPAFP